MNTLQNVHARNFNKQVIVQALANNDLTTLREASNYYYRTNGIYQKTCNTFATMYRYDWYIAPEVYDDDVSEDKVTTEFFKVLRYLDNSQIKKICADIALEAIKNGAYYGYVVPSTNGIVLQDLPIKYCRSRYSVGNLSTIEFNMRYFDDMFSDVNYRLKVLKMFPEEFSKGYVLYKQGKLPRDTALETCGSWYLLDVNASVKISFNNGDMPLFINALPAILDLEAAQELDRRKQMQKLFKILVQKLPIDKNGDLIFDIDEARDIHNNAVEMVDSVIGAKVLTTFTDVEEIDLSDNKNTATDDLERMERTVYNNLGISQNLFNADGNLAMQNSILNDEGSMRCLILQLTAFFDKILQSKKSIKNRFNFRFNMLLTTQYNYQALSKLYKEHVQNGHGKLLPQIALGHSQSSILNTIYFENHVLHLSEVMIPPLSSNTMNSEDLLDKTGQSGNTKNQNNTEGETGRPKKDVTELSDKSLANQESLS